MKPIERFQALLDGKKIRRTKWAPFHYIWYDFGNRELMDQALVRKSLVDIFDSDKEWQLYEEPKPVIKLTPDLVGRAVRLRDGTVTLLQTFDGSYYFVSYTTFAYHHTGSVVMEAPSSLDIVEILPRG